MGTKKIMDPKILEEKLEKDNLTLKEHILKLQNTIKNIKSDINHNNTSNLNTLTNETSLIKDNSPKNQNLKQNLKEENSDDEINDLKFSFKNIKVEQKLLKENNKKRLLLKAT